MATLTIPNTFTSGTTISSSEMNANFAAIAAAVNGNIDTTNIANEAVTLAKLSTSLQASIAAIATNTAAISSNDTDIATNASAITALDTDLQGQIDTITADYAERAMGTVTTSAGTLEVTTDFQPNLVIMKKATLEDGYVWVVSLRLGSGTWDLALTKSGSNYEWGALNPITFTSTGFEVDLLVSGKSWYYYALR